MLPVNVFCTGGDLGGGAIENDEVCVGCIGAALAQTLLERVASDQSTAGDCVIGCWTGRIGRDDMLFASEGVGCKGCANGLLGFNAAKVFML